MPVHSLQLVAVLAAVGFIAALLFDFYRVIRSFYLPPRWLTFLLDLMFCIVITGIILSVLFWGNWLEIRFYVFAASALGWGVYYFVFSAVFLKGGRRVGLTVARLFRKISFYIRRGMVKVKNFFNRQDK